MSMKAFSFVSLGRVLVNITLVFIFLEASASELSPVKPEKVGVSSTRLEHLDAAFQAFVDNREMAGSVILAARDGKVFYFKSFGYRDLESGAGMETDTIFRIASQTKALVSVATMVLQERGVLNIKDKVSRFIPEFAELEVATVDESGALVLNKAQREITIRDLLTHTSGFSYGSNISASHWEKAGIQGWYFADRSEPMLPIVTRMASLPLDAQPGEKWLYGYNTDILGAVLEVASGQSLEALLDELILDPLDMNDTHFFLPREKSDRLAVVYTPSENGQVVRSPQAGTMNAQGHYVSGPRKAFSGGAGLLSTAEDYAKFLQMLLNNGKYGKKRILSRKSVELMVTDHLGDTPYREGSGFGLGFRIIEDLGVNGELGSEGMYRWGGAYRSTYWVDPKENLLVVYFTQIRPATTIDDHAKLRTLIYQSIVD
jgi:CubicO group peptidase (beta-lactamase class C family)